MTLTTFCSEHAETPILYDSGGRDYCPRCIDSDVKPAEVFTLLVKLVNAIRLLADSRDDYKAYSSAIVAVRSALDEAEEFLELRSSA